MNTGTLALGTVGIGAVSVYFLFIRDGEDEIEQGLAGGVTEFDEDNPAPEGQAIKSDRVSEGDVNADELLGGLDS